ncbi:uncharacterized protein [Rutidosis leptorrhynchoides]|uniref:uncharacterized protein n=1 Tax=Rutidosis leptorrhynchoides TaxID=125765 RepID=UPI003A9A5289
MAVMNGDTTEKTNGGALPPLVVEDENKETSSSTTSSSSLSLASNKPKTDQNSKDGAQNNYSDVNLKGVFEHLIRSFLDQNSLQGIKKSLIEAAPMFREAIVNARRDLLIWTRRDNIHLRGLLVVSVGIVTLLALTGLLVFMMFFAAATVNAIVISLLISLAAVGGFLAIFFTCLTAMYICVLFFAALVTFTVTISSIVAALVAAGWIGFIWITWFAVSKGAAFAKRYMSIAYAAANASGQRNTATFTEPVAM